MFIIKMKNHCLYLYLTQTLKKIKKHYLTQCSKGQTVLEFLLLLATLVLLSSIMLKFTNRTVARLWKPMIESISRPSHKNLDQIQQVQFR